MTLRFAENFGIYGVGTTTPRANLAQVQGVLTVSTVLEIVSSPVRGLGTRALRFGVVGGTDADAYRFGLGADYTEVIAGAAFYLDGIPSANDRTALFQFRDNANGNQLTLLVTSTGALRVLLGGIASATQIGISADGVMISGAYQFVEFYANVANSGGAVEVRVDGVTVVFVTGVDTQGTAVAGCAQINVARSRTSGGVTGQVMDLYALTVDGTINNDFLGDTQWVTIFPDADTAETDWVRNTGSNDFAAINNNPQDGDTTYLDGNNVGDISEFEVADLPAGVGEVIAIVTRSVMRKTNAGDGSAQISLISSLASPETTVAGTNRALTEVYASYPDIFETDPETGAPWAPAAVNALRLKIERTL